MKILIFDTETGGLDSSKHSLLSIGAIVGDLDTGKILSTFECFHKMNSLDSYVCTEQALKINGLELNKVFTEGTPTFELRNEFHKFYMDSGANIIGGHNVDFDIRMLAAQLYGGISIEDFNSMFSYRKIDSNTFIRLVAGANGISGKSLEEAIKQLNIDMSDCSGCLHNALFDAIATFRIISKFRKVLTTPEVIKLLQ